MRYTIDNPNPTPSDTDLFMRLKIEALTDTCKICIRDTDFAGTNLIAG